ncbi:MAG: hypothetical protein V9G04_00105 [Nocardioides sp.]
MTLDQRGGVHLAYDVSLTPADPTEPFDRVQPLGQARTHPGAAQRLGERDVAVEQTHERSLSSRMARS